MRRFALSALLPLVVVASACGRNAVVESEPSPSASVGAPAFPVGTYDYSADVNGETRTGAIVIQGTPGTYTGYVTLDGEPEAATMSNIRTEGSRLTFEAQAPGERFTFDVTFTGSTFSGSVIAPMGSIPVTGSRRAN